MISKGNSSISFNMLLKKYTEQEILEKYLRINKLPCLISSPFRIDSNPSFSIYVRNNRIKYKDFATKEYGGLISLLSRLWNKPVHDVINDIYNDHATVIPLSAKSTRPSKIFYSHHEYCKNGYKIREWKQCDFDYWEQYGISKEWLDFADIHPISYIIIKKGNIKYNIPTDELAYVYIEHKDGNESIKIYQPYSKIYKWRNFQDSSVWDLFDKLPEHGDKLIITSSRKDALCIWENTGIPATSLQSENCLPKSSVIANLKERFKNIFILYDNDFNGEKNWGHFLGKRIAETFQLIQIEIPRDQNSKDTSDLCKNHGRERVKEIINLLINQKLLINN